MVQCQALVRHEYCATSSYGQSTCRDFTPGAFCVAFSLRCSSLVVWNLAGFMRLGGVSLAVYPHVMYALAGETCRGTTKKEEACRIHASNGTLLKKDLNLAMIE